MKQKESKLFFTPAKLVIYKWTGTRSNLPMFSQQLCDLSVAANIKWAAVLCAVCSSTFVECLSLPLLGFVTSWIGDAHISLNKKEVSRVEESWKNILQSTLLARLLVLQATAFKNLFKIMVIRVSL